ncbi:hypothetical protein HYX18_00595 [Candidatus Woesearchaeota archaeon]|nr:hypothetical protein [Candidatus Woesearchaeota archaeon]
MILNKKIITYVIILLLVFLFLYAVRFWIEPLIDKSNTFTNIINQSLRGPK